MISGTSETHNELATDEFTLLLGVVLSLQTSQELFTGVHNGKVDTELLLQNILDKLTLVQSHAAVVDQHTVIVSRQFPGM